LEFKVKYTSRVFEEFNKAFVDYSSKEKELGQRFKDAFNKIRSHLKENPKLFTEIDLNHRRAVLGSSFPYTVHYLVNDTLKTITIIGLFHQSKNLETIKEQVKLQKVHLLRKEKEQIQKERLQQLKNIHNSKELEKSKERTRDRGFEL